MFVRSMAVLEINWVNIYTIFDWKSTIALYYYANFNKNSQITPGSFNLTQLWIGTFIYLSLFTVPLLFKIAPAPTIPLKVHLVNLTSRHHLVYVFRRKQVKILSWWEEASQDSLLMGGSKSRYSPDGRKKFKTQQ